MNFVLRPWQLLLLILAGWINRDQQDALTKEQMGWILSGFFWSYASFQVPAGWLGDRWGSRLTLPLYSSVWSGTTALSALAGTFVTVWLVQVFNLGSPVWFAWLLPDLLVEAPAAALLAAVVPPVRSGPGQGEQSSHRPRLPAQGSARVEENQAGLAGVELLDRSGLPDPASLDTRHPAFGSSPGSKLTAPRSRGCVL